MKRKHNAMGTQGSADPLDRLLRSAAQAKMATPSVQPLSWTAEAKVLGAWRASRSTPATDSWLAFFRTGVAVAGAAALLTVLVTLRNGGDHASDASFVNDEVAATHAAFNVAVLN